PHDLTFAAETLERGLVLDRGSRACDEPLAGLLGDVTRLEPLGLAPPPVAALSVALDLPGRPVRAADAARALARVARGRPGPSIDRPPMPTLDNLATRFAQRVSLFRDPTAQVGQEEGARALLGPLTDTADTRRPPQRRQRS